VDSTVIAYGIRFFCRFPYQDPLFPGSFCDCIDCLTIFESETQMRKILLRLISTWTAWQNHKDEIIFTALFSQPNNLVIMACPLMNNLHLTIRLIKLNTGIQVPDMKC
jgi:hypothetical protein